MTQLFAVDLNHFFVLYFMDCIYDEKHEHYGGTMSLSGINYNVDTTFTDAKSVFCKYFLEKVAELFPIVALGISQ